MLDDILLFLVLGLNALNVVNVNVQRLHSQRLLNLDKRGCHLHGHVITLLSNQLSLQQNKQGSTHFLILNLFHFKTCQLSNVCNRHDLHVAPLFVWCFIHY